MTRCEALNVAARPVDKNSKLMVMSCNDTQQSCMPLARMSCSMYLGIDVHKVTGKRNGILFCSAPIAALFGYVVDLGADLPH